MAKFTLPPLPYDYGALEPHISGKIMELHHDKHHAAYVTGANTVMEKLHDARQKNDFAAIPLLEKQLAFHTSGHVMHSLFWQNLTPKGGGEPTGDLAAAIQRDFGSFEAFKNQMTQATATIMGSGWGALEWDPVAKRLLTAQIYDHQSNTAMGGVPLFVIDAWEHAFYLQYGPAKADFFKAVWNIVNWDDIAARYKAVQSLDLSLKGAVA